MRKSPVAKYKIDIFTATFFSAVFNPFIVIIPTIVIAFFAQIQVLPGAFLFFLCVLFFPVFFYYLEQIYRHKKDYDDIVNLNRSERAPIYLFGVFSSLFNAVIFSHLQQYFWVEVSMLALVVFASIFLINKYIDKLSMHTFFFSLSIMLLIDKINLAYGIFFVVMPIVFWSRITLHKHSWLQLYLGTVLGMIIGLISWMI